MAVMATRRSIMTCFTDPVRPDSHQVRLVLAEKGVTVDVIEVDPDQKPEDLLELNPYGSTPTLVDRELVLYEVRTIAEYLDERFPHPPLMPVDPVSRARSRTAIYHIERDWYRLLPDLESDDAGRAEQARKELREGLIANARAFAAKPFFLSDEFSLVDCALAPLLWRLGQYGIKLPREAAPVQDYAERIFARESFQASLTERERDLRL